MKKKILMLLVSVLAVAMLSVPVMGKPATKIEVTIELTDGVQQQYIDTVRWVSDGTISHGRGTSSNTVSNAVKLTIGQVSYYGNRIGEWISTGRWKKDPVVLVIMGKHTLTFPGGTFESAVHRKIIGWPPNPPDVIPIFEDHRVYQGTGIFKGQTLKYTTAEGYLLIMPK